MTKEQNKTLEAVQISIQMEIDGRDYYLKTSQNSSSEMGKKLLKTLADEEDLHRRIFEQIYTGIQEKNNWPPITRNPDGCKSLRTIFAQATDKMGSNVKTPLTELNAVQTAINMESKSYDFYENQGNISNYDTARYFYKALAAEEREHQLILLDYYEYLKDSAGWFFKKEHASLDGS